MTASIRVETITLGDELLLGIRENAHLTYLGRQLAHHGIEPAANLVIRDQPDDIRTFFADAWKRSDLIITCLLYTSPSPRDISGSRMPSSA